MRWLENKELSIFHSLRHTIISGIVKADDIGYFLMQLKKDNFSEKFAALKTEREKAEQTFLRKTWQTICQIATQIITMFFYNNLGIKILNYIGKTTVILMPRFMKFLTVWIYRTTNM